MKRLHKNLRKVLAIVLVCTMLTMSMGAYSGEVEFSTTALEAADTTKEGVLLKIENNALDGNVISISNIEQFVEAQLEVKSEESIATELYLELGYTEREINEMDNERLLSILDSDSVTVKTMYIKSYGDVSISISPEDGFNPYISEEEVATLFSSSLNPYDVSYNYENIISDSGDSGYMAGRIELRQTSEYDKVALKYGTYGSIIDFYAYGYDCYFSMWWITPAFFSQTDVFAINWDGDAYTDITYSENTAYFYEYSTAQIEDAGGFDFEHNLSDSKVVELDIAWSNSKPTLYFESVWGQGKVEINLKLHANDGFSANMIYGHTTSVLTPTFNISYPLYSSSISITSNRELDVYESGPLRVECQKDEDMEALRN